MMLRFDTDYSAHTRARLRRQRWMKRVERRVRLAVKYAERSTQAFVIAYWHFIRRRRPIVLSQLYAFARARGVKISYASLKYSLHYMREKGLLVRRGRGVYDLAEGLKDWDFKSIIKLLDLRRARAGRSSARRPRSGRGGRRAGKHAVSISEIRKKYNVVNIARHIERHLKDGRELEALAELIILCSGIRPSDLIEDISITRDGEVWLIVFERKTGRVRYVRFLGFTLMRLLRQRSELIDALIREFLERLLLAELERRRLLERRMLVWLMQLLLVINTRRKAVFDLCGLDDARRIYLAYEGSGRARYLFGGERREIERGRILNILEDDVERAVIGVHLYVDNDDYYILR